MVRLFVPEGENQHVVTMARHHGFPTEPGLFTSATRSCLIAAALTGAGALGGASAPGLFVKCVALVGLIDLPHTAFFIYGRRQLDSAVLKADNIVPKPGKLWERTSHFTVDDAYLSGGVLGVLATLNPRALPGVRGWKRIFGAATIGSAIGAQVGWKFLERRWPQHVITTAESRHWTGRLAVYREKLVQNDKAWASLAWPGMTVLWLHALAGTRIGLLTKRFGFRSQDDPHGAGNVPVVTSSPAIQQMSKGKVTACIDIERTGLTGHDIDGDNLTRMYKDSLSDKNAEALQERLDHLHELKEKTSSEAKFLWQELAKKERQFYDMAQEGYEKDILRRQLQLLNSMAYMFVQRDSIITYHIADARKQLGQIDHSDTNSQTDPAIANALESEVFIERESVHSPDLTIQDLRLFFLRRRETEALIQRLQQQHESIHSSNPESKDTNKHIENAAEQSKRNVEATERLLKELEAQALKAEATAAKKRESNAAQQE